MVKFGILRSTKFSRVMRKDSLLHLLNLGLFEHSDGLQRGKASILCIVIELRFGLSGDDVVVIVLSHLRLLFYDYYVIAYRKYD